MSEPIEAEKVEEPSLDPKDIPPIDPDNFFKGADALGNLGKLKDILNDAEGLYGKLVETVNNFHEAGKGLKDLVNEGKAMVAKVKGGGNDGQPDTGDDSGNDGK